jgi:uncharacterized membrane protein YhaH (DUF805 family)
VNWYLDVLKKYAVFEGRAKRPEYWYFVLFNAIIAVVLAIIDGVLGTYPLFVGMYFLAVLLPALGVTIRRLHDTNRSGWWMLIALIPLVGSIVLLVFYVQDSTPGGNAYGPYPTAAAPEQGF